MIFPAGIGLSSLSIFNMFCLISGALMKLFLFKFADAFSVDHRKTPRSLRNYNY